MLRFSITCFLLLATELNALATDVRGYVRSEEGSPLAFATIYIKETETGTTTNADGYYEVKLDPGTYHLTFQFIGYESVTKEVTVGTSYTELDVILKSQVMMLQDIKVYAGKEDPAYTIMRKAIAKAKFHTQQIDRYTAEVYIKGKGQLLDAPFFMRKTLEKEGISEGRVFISESVSEIEYIRPNTYNEKVISVYTSGDDRNTSPNAYINGSFYEPEIAKIISPLSPRAFSYYRFIYDGTFREKGYEISKIRVVPRSKGDNVFEGYIQIVEDYWSIHSLELSTTKLGIKFNITQIYKPVEDKAWLPVTHEFEVSGKVLGFEFEGEYLATVSNYDIEINPELDVELEVIDEKVEKNLADKLEGQFDKEENKEVQELLTEGKEVTGKQLKKIIKAYEKAEREEQDDPQVVSNRTYKVDSLAYERDSTYWSKVRPVPLSKQELRGYHITDSIAEIERKESQGDTLDAKRDRSGFRLHHILTGGRYNIGDKAYFRIHFPDVQYNTVEGVNIDYKLSYGKTFKNKNWLSFGPTARYAFSREKFSGFWQTRYGFGEQAKRNTIDLRVGRYINQFNNDEPIHPLVNSLMALLLERNYMKIYEKDFASLSYSKKLSDKVNFNIKAEYQERDQLYNNTDYRLFDRGGSGFTQNAPVNYNLLDTSFPDHKALMAKFTMSYTPWVRYYIYNGKKRPIEGDAPTITLVYTKGVPDLLNSVVDYDLLELGAAYDFDIGVRGLVDMQLNAGIYLNDDEMYFMDYKHFMGNRTPVITSDPVGSFRLLDYYTFSTADKYFSANLHYQFRKFLVTQIPLVRLSGIREGFFVNYLSTGELKPYTELGYGINYIFRIIRVEAVTSFYEGKYQDWGIRIGVATNLDDIF